MEIMEISLLTPLDLDKFAHLYPESILGELPADAILIGCIITEPIDAAGILMAHVDDTDIVIDWLYVDEMYRRKGCASTMMKVLLDAAAESGELDSVTIIFSEEDEGMSEFLRINEFMVTYRGGDKGFSTRLGKIPVLPVNEKLKGQLNFLDDVPETEFSRFRSLLNEMVIPGVAIKLPFEKRNYLPESSAIMENGVIRAIFLVRKMDESIEVSWVYNNTNQAAAFPALINASVNQLKKSYPEDNAFCFASVSSKMDEFIEKCIPVESSSEIYFGSYMFGDDFGAEFE